ncbi:MAG: MFS transporter [Candidatus Aenigmatarchaeota archaeon]
MRKEEKLKALILVQTFIAFSLGFIGPIYSIYFEKISNVTELVPILFGIYWLFVGILEPIFGKYIDRIGKTKTFLIGCIVTAVAILLYPLANNIYILFLAQIIAAIGYSLEVPAYYAIVSEISRKEKRGSDIGKIDGFFNIAYGISAIFSAIVLYFSGFSALFLFSAILYILAGALAIKLIEEL